MGSLFPSSSYASRIPGTLMGGCPWCLWSYDARFRDEVLSHLHFCARQHNACHCCRCRSAMVVPPPLRPRIGMGNNACKCRGGGGQGIICGNGGVRCRGQGLRCPNCCMAKGFGTEREICEHVRFACGFWGLGEGSRSRSRSGWRGVVVRLCTRVGGGIFVGYIATGSTIFPVFPCLEPKSPSPCVNERIVESI